MTLQEKLGRAIKRSQRAYELYLGNKYYYQALRIFNANETVYLLLQDFVYECKESDLDQVFLYLFHLEDWFRSFKLMEQGGPDLNDTFVFERLNDSPAFPAGFVKNILS